LCGFIGAEVNCNMPKTEKRYLIDRLINENWFETEKEALPWIISGKVLVNNRQIFSGKEKVPADGIIRVKEYYKKKYVNKGGLKLQGALSDFGIDVQDKIALDCGASTGGFTDCLLQHGAKLVYAVDAAHGELAGKLLIDKNIINMERTNLSDDSLKELSPKPDIITLDLSYLSLKKGVMICREILKADGVIIALIKPSVEVSSEIKSSGNINQRDVIYELLADLCGYFRKNNFDIIGLTYSPVRGNNDAVEYFICLRPGEGEPDNINNTYELYFDEIIGKSFALGKFDKNNVSQTELSYNCHSEQSEEP